MQYADQKGQSLRSTLHYLKSVQGQPHADQINLTCQDSGDSIFRLAQARFLMGRVYSRQRKTAKVSQ